MRRLLALLALSALVLGVFGVGSLGVVACGGNDKPPLTPDNLEPTVDNHDGPEAGTTPAPGTSPPAAK